MRKADSSKRGLVKGDGSVNSDWISDRVKNKENHPLYVLTNESE